MPVDVRAAYDRAVDDMPPLHSGARIAAKLKAKIIVNGSELNNAGEMSVEDRHSLHEALEALVALSSVVSTPEINRGKKLSIVIAARGYLSRAARLLRLKR